MTQAFEAQSVLAELAAIVGPLGLLVGDDCQPYAQGARYGGGVALGVVRPATAQEVGQIVAVCVKHRVQVVAQGANTGLVGASTPDATGRQIVLSLQRLRKECSIDVANRSVTVDAGLTLQELNDKLQPHGMWFPVDLGANPSIGGMVAANTGGTRLIRYGDVRHNLLAMEVVLFNDTGDTLRLGSALRKDNTGFDLEQLFVGTSGVGGIITRVSLEIHPRPKQSATALVVPTSDDAVVQLLQVLEAELGDFVSAFEGMSANAMRAAIEHVPSVRNPFAPQPLPPMAILIELESSASPIYTGLDLQEALNRFLQDQFETLISDAVVSNGPELWALRHGISEGARAMGKPIAFDVSVPRSRTMHFIRTAKDYVHTHFPYLLVVDFGHIADGGVHFNLIWPHEAQTPYDGASVQRLRDDLYAMVVDEFGGSFSAEHGIGPHNLRYYRKYTSDAAMALAGGIKRLLDPQGLCGSVDFGLANVVVKGK